MPTSTATPSSDARGLRKVWQQRGPLAWLLWPLSKIYGALAQQQAQQQRQHAQHAGVPTIVVGNVIAGGAGKTPVTQAIVRHLRAQGYQPGIISRGYGRTTTDTREVLPTSPAIEVGDEPLLLARSTQVPVFVARQRIDAARALRAAHPQVNVLVCDDGLQHHALARDVQVCVFHDGGVGNGWLLPAGPLREPWPRPVDAVLYAGRLPQGTPESQPSFALQRQLAPMAVRADGQQLPLAQLRGQPVHAVAAIARPERFFAMLAAMGLTLARTQALPDHYNFNSWSSAPAAHETLLCTEKDAVKLWAVRPDAWAVPLQVQLPDAFFTLLDQRLSQSPTWSAPRA